MEAGDNRQIATILKQYKTKGGEVNYPAVLSVPLSERLPALFEKDFMKATALVVGALALAFEKMSFKAKKNEVGVLVNNIAEEILNSCDEDNLSLEDLVLFLQGLVRGKYGIIEDISVTKFMSLFDKYRDDRHLALIEYRENEHLVYKGLGDNTRSSVEDQLSNTLMRIQGTMAELKQSLK